jgi:hypothetical protein
VKTSFHVKVACKRGAEYKKYPDEIFHLCNFVLAPQQYLFIGMFKEKYNHLLLHEKSRA